MSQNVARASTPWRPVLPAPLLALTLDFDELVDQPVAETAARTMPTLSSSGRGPGGRPVVAWSEGRRGGAAARQTTRPRPAIDDSKSREHDWTYSPAGEARRRPVPVGSDHTVRPPRRGEARRRGGVLVVPGAFRPEHAIGSVGGAPLDAGVALANARRFADVEARVNVDPATGIRNRRGYEFELGREVAPRRTEWTTVVGRRRRGRRDESPRGGAGRGGAPVTGVTRRSDISCRRGERELASSSPAPRSPGTVLTRRLRDAAKKRSAPACPRWPWASSSALPAETPEELDSRIEHMFGHREPRSRRSTTLGTHPPPVRRPSTARSPAAPTSSARRRTSSGAVLEVLARELADREFGARSRVVGSRRGGSTSFGASGRCGVVDGADPGVRAASTAVRARIGASPGHDHVRSSSFPAPGSRKPRRSSSAPGLARTSPRRHGARTECRHHRARRRRRPGCRTRTRRACPSGRRIRQGPEPIVVAVPNRRPLPPR